MFYSTGPEISYEKNNDDKNLSLRKMLKADCGRVPRERPYMSQNQSLVSCMEPHSPLSQERAQTFTDNAIYYFCVFYKETSRRLMIFLKLFIFTQLK